MLEQYRINKLTKKINKLARKNLPYEHLFDKFGELVNKKRDKKVPQRKSGNRS